MPHLTQISALEISWLATFARGLVEGYRVAFSWMFPGSCRYWPSCSAYAIEAVDRHGAARGGWLALRRLVRCRPGGGWGHDPVPPVT